MLTAVIEGPTCELAKKQIEEALPHAEALEFRLDRFSDFAGLDQLVRPLTTIFTLKNGLDPLKFASLRPDFIDLDFQEDISSLKTHYPHIPIIRSYHGNVIPRRYPEGDIIKIAVEGNSTLDALKMLLLKADKPLVAISMGDRGVVSRLLGRRFGSPFTYAYLNSPVAPGQQPLVGHPVITPSTRLFGLIGTSVSQSPSHITHNRYFQEMGLDAYYVKMVVEKEELEEFCSLIRLLPFEGLSVTVALKEAILPYLDEIDQEAKEIGAVNTLVIREGKIKGYNTDGIGALTALQRSVSGKKVTIYGAGGSARAIAFEAKKRGAQVTVVNRNKERAIEVASRLGCSFGEMVDGDIVINTTPIVPTTPHLDIDLIRGTPFALEMFHAQAYEQFRLWNIR